MRTAPLQCILVRTSPMRNVFIAFLAIATFTATLRAHNVIYSSAAGTFTQGQGTILLPGGNTMTLTRGADGTISVIHFPSDEHCIVTASVAPPASDNPLVTVTPKDGVQTALDVIFT